jgi:HK97 family phage portal protein
MPVLESGGQLLSASGQPTGLSRSSVPFSAYTQRSIELVGGGRISYAQLYRRQPMVHTVVNKLARQIARLPLKVYKPGSQPGERHQVHDGPLVELLGKPAPRVGAASLKQWLSLSPLVYGNGLIGKSRPSPAAPPNELRWVPWLRATPRAHEDDEPIELWEIERSGRSEYLDPDDVIHVAWEAPDSVLGVSPLEALAVTLKLEDAAQRYGTASFTNGARPGGALVFPENMNVSREERAEVKDAIHESHGGVDKAFEAMVLGGGVKWEEIAHSARDAELVETRKLTRDEVCAVYDIPGPMIGILDHATFANVTEQHRMLYTTIIGPWLSLAEDAVQHQLIDPEPAFAGQFVKFDLNKVLQGDPRERAVAYRNWMQSGVYTIDELRDREDLPRFNLPETAKPLIPTNNVAPAGAAGLRDDGVDALSRHLERAEDRVLRRSKAGAADPLDRDRFVSELAADTGEHGVAAVWGDALAAGIENAADEDSLRHFLTEMRRTIG